MNVRILGCGTSTGVPRLGSGWGACDPAEPRNRRLRSSILLESGGETLLVDCGPDLREQLLASGLGGVDRVLVTHDHADHCHGIDDLRPIAQARGEPVPLLARLDVLQRLESRFRFQDGKIGPTNPKPAGEQTEEPFFAGFCILLWPGFEAQDVSAFAGDVLIWKALPEISVPQIVFPHCRHG